MIILNLFYFLSLLFYFLKSKYYFLWPSTILYSSLIVNLSHSVYFRDYQWDFEVFHFICLSSSIFSDFHLKLLQLLPVYSLNLKFFFYLLQYHHWCFQFFLQLFLFLYLFLLILLLYCPFLLQDFQSRYFYPPNPFQHHL